MASSPLDAVRGHDGTARSSDRGPDDGPFGPPERGAATRSGAHRVTADLLYHVDQPSASAQAVLSFLFDSLGIAALSCPPPELWERPHLVYGNSTRPGALGIAIPRHPGDVFWGDVLRGGPPTVASDGSIPFDLIGAIEALLTDVVHGDVPPADLDRHGRLSYGVSRPAREGFGDTPIVNVYVECLRRILADRLAVVGRPRWPDGRVAAIALSHDVDMPDKYALLGSATRPWRLRRHPRTYVRKSIELARQRATDPTPRDHWLFDAVADSESSLGFRSTFFFATVPFHAAVGAPWDVAYDVRGRPYRRVLASLVDGGFEIGLHASYRAHEDPSRLAAERGLLETLTKRTVTGVRHHYWHLGSDVARTLRAHEGAGFTYDTSLAFNDHIGYRRAIALPFHPFDAELGRPLRTLQLPTFCMDGNLFGAVDNVDAAVEAVVTAINVIVSTGGMGAINWHIQTSYPGNRQFRMWGTVYQEILRWLASRTDIWVTRLGDIATWVSREHSSAAVGDLP